MVFVDDSSLSISFFVVVFLPPNYLRLLPLTLLFNVLSRPKKTNFESNANKTPSSVPGDSVSMATTPEVEFTNVNRMTPGTYLYQTSSILTPISSGSPSHAVVV